ncbi:suberization-associated anionic peroxidase-like [Lycium ferocissimum]|uniref:suberization-associated anionic peroxidase-like n=1 Tax=Lycium ferocissimum TaxID=112874 RepID=UPI00281536AD|nr:suberization-associated anionic peroxidase-like [Lycium ferocissimum]
MAFSATNLSLALSLMALIVLAKADFNEKVEPINNILEKNSEMLTQEFCILGAVGSVVAEAIMRERRMGASLIRLFFHDCFVDGCDAGILLNDIPGRFQGEKTSPPNDNSVRGYEVIDQAKQRIKTMCPGAFLFLVLLLDILALSLQMSNHICYYIFNQQLGGIPYPVRLGRRDARTANFTGALTQLPAPFDNLSVQLTKFSAKGMSAREMVALVGAHTVGFARCLTMCDDRNINPARKSTLNCGCPVSNNNTNLVPLDLTTPDFFDKFYYEDLIRNRALLFSDQVLMGSSATADVVRAYNNNPALFLREFNAAMTKLGDLPPSRGVQLEIRDVCSRVNGNSIAEM